MQITQPSRTSFTELEVVPKCHKWGGSLLLDGTGLDGAKLLWAISGRESTFGTNIKPRFEASYAKNVSPQMIALRSRLGDASACSFGPWQLMAVNVTPFLESVEQFADLDFCAAQTVNHINIAILRAQGAKTLTQIADAYNSGNFHDKIVPAQYIADVVRYYDSYSMPVTV